MKFKLLLIPLILSLLPAAALAKLEIKPADGVSDGGSMIVLSGNYKEYTISGAESGVRIIAQDGVERLSLYSASITAPNDHDALTAEGSLQLHLIGDSAITGGSGSEGSNGNNKDGCRGIVLPDNGVLTISGDGSLIVKGGNGGLNYGNFNTGKPGKNGGAAIEARVTLISGTLKAYGGMASDGTQAGYLVDAGVGGDGGIAIRGSVIAQGGTLEAAGGTGGNGGEPYQTTYNHYGNGHGGTGGAAISGDLTASGLARVTATGGKGGEAGWDTYTWGNTGEGGNAIGGNLTASGSAVVNATGGNRSEDGKTGSEKSGHGVVGDVSVSDSASVTATGGNAQGGYWSQSGIGAHGVNGSAQINGGRLIAKGGAASGDQGARGGSGINGSAAIHGGMLEATGGSASGNYGGTGGNGVNGSFTAAGGYACAKGGPGKDGKTGKAAASAAGSCVTIGSSGKHLTASAGMGESPDEPLNDGKYYAAAKDETTNVSGKRSLETKEHFAVTYVCSRDGCEQTATDYADCSETYKVKTPASIGFEAHGLAFAGFVDTDGITVGSRLTISEPITLSAVWKAGFSFHAGEGGTGEMPHKEEITFDGWVRLPECGFNPPEGYRFAGWMIDGDDQIYAAGDQVPASRDIVLIAVWERIPAPPDPGDPGDPSVPGDPGDPSVSGDPGDPSIPSLPDTGDSSTPMLWLILCLGACVSLLRLRRGARD